MLVLLFVLFHSVGVLIGSVVAWCREMEGVRNPKKKLEKKRGRSSSKRK